MNLSAWDRHNLAAAVDAYWDNANEVAFRANVVKELSEVLVPGAILDAGCGSGRIYGALQEAHLLADRDYLGVDGSREMLFLAGKRYPAGHFVLGDVTEFRHPAPNVLCIQVLQHVADWQVVLTNLFRSVGSVLYLTAWFGAGDRHLDAETGIWNNWLSGREVTDFCSRYGVVQRGKIADGTIGSLIVRRT